MNYRKAFSQTILASLLTCFVYIFYSGEFIRESVEDFSFDALNKYMLKGQEERVDAPNLLLFKIDDYYLREKKLLDKNGETTYGYLLPRSYLANIIVNIDELVKEMEPENYPSTMFIDYDMSYSSDPNNKILTKDDLYLFEVLKRDRPYKIYFPKTLNYNMIESSKDDKIQELIANGKIALVSVGLTIAKDGISRRYYAFEKYYNQFDKEVVYPLVDIAIFNDIKKKNRNVEGIFSQDRISVIENRIIFKGYSFYEEIDGSEFIQSNWDNLKIFSANYDLESIIEEDFSNAVIFIGGDHNNNGDVFVMDDFDSELSGIEMHANALMTLFYLDGKLNRLSLIYALLIICPIIFFNELLLQYLMPKIRKLFKNGAPKFLETFQEEGFILLTIIMLFAISYYLLTNNHIWFNWLIPSLMAGSLLLFITTYKFIKRIKFIKYIRFLIWLKTIRVLRRTIRKILGGKK